MSPIAILAGSLAAILTLLPQAGCSWRRNAFQAGVPGIDTPFYVSRVNHRDGILDALLRMEGGDTELRLFTPAEPSCDGVLQPEARVTWSPSGAVGTLTRGDRTCRVTGIGSLELWRERRPEPTGLRATPVPREQAVFDVVYEDAEVLLLRGRFPLASLVGWTDLADSIAVVPRRAPCTSVAEEGVASMQYYPAGTPALALLSGSELCPIRGLIQPPAR